MGVVESLARLDWKASILQISPSPPEPGNCFEAGLKEIGIDTFKWVPLSPMDHYVGRVAGLFKKNRVSPPAIDSPFFRRRVFHALMESKPDLILTDSTGWVPLLNLANGCKSAIDCVDIWTWHLRQLESISSRFPWEGWLFPAESDPIICEDIFEKIHMPTLDNEMNRLSHFDTILAISPTEAEAIRGRIWNGRVETIPMCADPVEMDNSYSGQALFVGHNHPFNAQAYAYFVARVLPMIQADDPGFTFRVLGSDTGRFPRHAAAETLGFVDDIRAEYKTASFLLVPVLGGTGQMTRVVEAMAHGLAVVATRSAARSSPIRHGHNGFICANNLEMARHALELHRDRGLARRMGNAARETVRADFSMGHLRARVARIFGRG